MASEAEILEESRRVRRLQVVVEEAAELVASTRRFALSLFPDKGPTYDLIYAPRFRRLMWEKYRVV